MSSRVRVESSKNVETIVLPRNAGTLGIGRGRPRQSICQPHDLVDAVRPEVGHAQEVTAVSRAVSVALYTGPLASRVASRFGRRSPASRSLSRAPHARRALDDVPQQDPLRAHIHHLKPAGRKVFAHVVRTDRSSR